MKYRTQYDFLDPEVVPDDSKIEAKPEDADAPDDAYTIGEHGNTVKAPDADARARASNAPKPWVKPLSVGLAITFVAMTSWNVARVIEGPPPPPKPTPIQLKQTLYLGVMRIDAYRRVHSVTPDRLSDVGLPENVGYTYQRVDPWHYVLGFQNQGPKLEYDSSVPKETFFGSPNAVLSMGDKP